ncbi:hypothetical protein D3C85_1043660 [compost metagenome]
MQGVAVLADVYRIGKARVRRAAVVALHVVVDDGFPVGWRVADEASSQLQVVDHRASAAHARFQARQLVFDGAGVGVHVDEDEACVFLDLQLYQAVVTLVEGFDRIAIAHVGQLAVQLEGPGVVRAGDHVLGFAAAFEQLVATVRANVVERAQHAVATTDDDDAFADHFAGNVGIVFHNFAAVPYADPALGEDLFFLVLEDCRAGVEAGRNGVSVLWLAAEIGRQTFEVGHLGISWLSRPALGTGLLIIG